MKRKIPEAFKASGIFVPGNAPRVKSVAGWGFDHKNRIDFLCISRYDHDNGEPMDENLNPVLPNDETCWQAVQARDARYNGRVYFGVRSTRVYCKPSCPARRPQRGQVVFFASCDQAEAAGFRPCRRCQPRRAADPQVELAAKACRLIEAAGGNLSLGELGRQVGVSPYHLQRLFKAVTGVTPRQYAASWRMRQFKAQVRQGQTVTNALYEAGFGSNSRLYEAAAEQLGMTPASYRRGGREMKIRYTIADCYLGRLLVATTPRGICAVGMGENDAELEAFLMAEYPAAEISRGEGRLEEWVQAVLDYLDGERPQLDLPLDVQATAFQLRVWEELRRIPYGETRTYSQVAAAIGRPGAVRAVGRACATNPAALVTPCHRVVGADGSLAGYRWGMERKQALLARERSRKERHALAGS